MTYLKRLYYALIGKPMPNDPSTKGGGGKAEE